MRKLWHHTQMRWELEFYHHDDIIYYEVLFSIQTATKILFKLQYLEIFEHVTKPIPTHLYII